LIPKRAFSAAPANQISAKILSFVQWLEAAFGAASGAPRGAGADSANAIRDKIHGNFSGPKKPAETALSRLHITLETQAPGRNVCTTFPAFPRRGFLRLGRIDTK
jgi:hypothetical protein